ncbi:ABC transporter ATP-binding protein [Flavihumibacter fluvii]|uniref:ABC transporter ATP-binding protein n=1 Tax=Flavihumibacter fluvii TaxID=2838157 RepID=UPI001BDF5337|nr:ABC transporter ATP-binding protein [Flavihumibacter fluvii]ULQ54816.1 ABC transporter ATP-binding protein [Flavihumibacter fluvii]
MAHPLLSIENLTVGFGTVASPNRAIEGITLTVNRGEIVAIVGESGSGKSVTSLSILQLLPEKNTHYLSGKLQFSANGESLVDLLTLSNAELRKFRGAAVSMIFQEPMTSLNPVFTCGEQVMEAIRVHKKCTSAEARFQALELFRKVMLPAPEAIMKRYPHEISGGQKQRVMIAMAISCAPALLIADEPTTALDVTVQKNILDLLADLQAQTNMGLIFITHDLGVVQDIAHKVVVMFQGKIVEQNSAKEIFRNPAHPYTKALLACRPIIHPKGRRLPVVSDFWQPGESDQPNFQPLVKSSPAVQLPAGKELLKIEQLSVWFPTQKNILGKAKGFTKAVDDLSFSVFEGETLGIVGESGCGKTTLGRALLRLIPATAGRVWYKERDLLSLSKRELQAIRKNIQIVFQDPYGSLNPRITVGEAIREAMEVHGIGHSKKARKDKVLELLEKVHLSPNHFDRYPHAFSGGQRQRIGIARALALDPGFIVFDESVSALDVSIQAQVLNLINDLKAEFGFTALFISHDLGVVRYISDRILVMKSGHIEEIGTAEAVFNAPQSIYTRNLLDAIPGNSSLSI